MNKETIDAIRIEGISKRYGRTLALDDVSLNVKRGELYALLGPNGAGKTTLVHILSTILKPDGGKAFVAGHDVVRQPLRARRNIGVVFQEPSLDDRLTVFENLEFHGLVFGVPRKLRRKRIDELLAIVELADWRDSLVRTLSGGMKRRLEIARALVHDAQILFLDEPTTGLDAQSRVRIWEHIAQLQEERDLSIVVTTHYIEEVENCDTVCIIDHGKVLVQDTPEALKAKFGHELMRVTASDEDTARELREKFASRLTDAVTADDELLLRLSDNGTTETGFVEEFLSNYGNRLKQIRVDQPTLESVFLSLTGRELRDEAASARDRTYAFGKRGGEHTK